MKLKILSILILGLFFSSCLQTRTGMGANQQSQVYRKKNIENQNAESEVVVQKVDERDELIRTLNGRVESLESQIQNIQKEKISTQGSVNPDTQKIALLQEALTKMELQIQRLEGNDKPATQIQAHKSSDSNIPAHKKEIQIESSGKKQNPFEIGEDHFQKKEWK